MKYILLITHKDENMINKALDEYINELENSGKTYNDTTKELFISGFIDAILDTVTNSGINISSIYLESDLKRLLPLLESKKVVVEKLLKRGE